MPAWAKEALAKIKAQEKIKEIKEQGGTLMEVRALTQPEQKYTYAQSMQLRDRRDASVISVGILAALGMALQHMVWIPESNGNRWI